MLDAMTHFYETSYANVHRGVYELAERATEALEDARERCRAFVNAPTAKRDHLRPQRDRGAEPRRVRVGPPNLGPGDVVLVTELEHHSNFVPWQFIARKTGADFRMLPVETDGTLQLDELDELAGNGNVKVVATGSCRTSSAARTRAAHRGVGARARRDPRVRRRAGAPHKRVDVQALGTDFVAVSGHKMCGPSGIGFLWGKHRAAARDGPVPHRRPHDPPGARGRDDVGRAAAQVRGRHRADGRGRRARRGDRLPGGSRPRGDRAARARARRVRARQLAEIPGITQWGPPPDRRAGIVSFDVEGVHPHDVAQILDLDGVAIRAGHHCCQPLMGRSASRRRTARALPLHRARGDRPARRGPAQGAGSAFGV